jgi:hypothetical protein
MKFLEIPLFPLPFTFPLKWDFDLSLIFLPEFLHVTNYGFLIISETFLFSFSFLVGGEHMGCNSYHLNEQLFSAKNVS